MNYYYEETNKWEVHEAGFVENDSSYPISVFDREVEVGELVGVLCIPEELEGAEFDNYVMEHLIDNTYMLVDEARVHIYIEGEDGVAIVAEKETKEPIYILFQQRIWKRKEN